MQLEKREPTKPTNAVTPEAKQLCKVEEYALSIVKDKLEQIEKLLVYGHTEAFVKELLDISNHEWKVALKHNPELALHVKQWKLEADERVEAALYERARGYSHKDVDIKCFEGHVIKTPYIKHYPPDVQAAMFWLKNRKPEVWRDKVDVDVSGKVDHEHKHLHLVSDVDLQARIVDAQKAFLSPEAVDALS